MTEGPATVSDLVNAVGASFRGGHVERLVGEGMNHADHVISGEQPHA